MSGKWKQYAHERGMRRKISKLTCDICGEEFADLDKVATHRRVHQAAESEVEGGIRRVNVDLSLGQRKG